MKKLICLILALMMFAAYAETKQDTLDFYRKTLGEPDAVEKLMDSGHSYLVGMIHEDGGARVGYTCIDLDGDGKEELVIAADGEDAYFKGMLLEVVTDDGQLLVSAERDRFYLRADGMIVNVYSSGAMESGVTVYRAENGKLVRVEALEYSYSGNPEAPWSLFDGREWKSVTDEEALSWLDNAESDFVNLELTPISE